MKITKFTLGQINIIFIIIGTGCLTTVKNWLGITLAIICYAIACSLIIFQDKLESK